MSGPPFPRQTVSAKSEIDSVYASALRAMKLIRRTMALNAAIMTTPGGIGSLPCLATRLRPSPRPSHLRIRYEEVGHGELGISAVGALG